MQAVTGRRGQQSLLDCPQYASRMLGPHYQHLCRTDAKHGRLGAITAWIGNSEERSRTVVKRWPCNINLGFFLIPGDTLQEQSPDWNPKPLAQPPVILVIFSSHDSAPARYCGSYAPQVTHLHSLKVLQDEG